MHAVESLVVQLRAHAEECFFVASASRLGATCVVAWQTQLGAVLEIDVDIHDPREQLIYSAMMAPEGQTSFAAGAGGRYRVCFSNVNNGQYPKFVAFRIQCHELPDEVEQEMPQRREGDGGQRQNPISYHMLPNLAQKDLVGNLASDLSVLDLQLMNIVVEQRLFHSKLKSHRQIVEHTHEHVLLWRTVMCVSVAVATLVQMWFVKRLFDQKVQQLGNSSSGGSAVSSASASASGATEPSSTTSSAAASLAGAQAGAAEHRG